MLTRREFHVAAGMSTLGFARSAVGAPIKRRRGAYGLDLQVVTSHYDGKTCWVHPRAGIIPRADDPTSPRIVMTMNTLDVSGSDVFKAVYGMVTDDLGRHWSKPAPVPTLAVRTEVVDGVERPVAFSDLWPKWHAKSKTLLGTGHTVVYTPDWKVPKHRPRHTAYATYDQQRRTWRTWRKMTMPPGEKFADAGAGCTQRFDCDDGTILLPIYFRPPEKNSRVTIARCRCDGRTMTYVKHGTELNVDDDTRGLHEPSLTNFAGRWFLTIRNDKRGYVTSSDDPLYYPPIRPWRFDDGSDLGNYNTQQHWVTHANGLYLVYTRRGAGNDHVFRHRAPLFMARVDPERLHVIRSTEQILVPERGARLGNFGVTQVSPTETWVTVAEWMQTWGPNYIMPVDNKYGANGSVYVARIRWRS